MPAKFMIADEVNDSRTADILSTSALKTGQEFLWVGVPSGTASGVLVNAPIYLHSVIVPATGNLGFLMIGDVATACATALDSGLSASAVAFVDLAARGTYIFDTLISQTACYRLTGLDCKGIRVTYQLA